jgi:hypothetical protein
MQISGQPAPEYIPASEKAKAEQINKILSGDTDAIVKPADDASASDSPQVPEKKPEIDPGLAPESDQAPLVADDQQDPDDASANQSDQDEEPKPVTLKDLAESLDVESKDLYDVEIPIGSGDEAVSLGTLKDSHKELTKLNATRESYDDAKLTAENELMVSKRQVAQLIQMGQKAGLLTSETLNDIDNIHSANLQRERASLLDAIHEWKDPITRDREFEEIVDVLSSEYGIPRHEIEQSMDHRLVKFTNDAVRLMKSVRAAKALAKNPPKTVRAGGRQGSGKTALQTKIDAAKGGTQKQKQDAINLLLSDLN